MNLIKSGRKIEHELFRDYLNDFVPKRIFDIHAHLYRASHFPTIVPALANYPVLGMKDYLGAMARYFPRRAVEGLFFGFPKRGNDRVAINEWMVKEVDKGPGKYSRVLALVSPEDDPAAVAVQIRELGMVGIKSYHAYAPLKNTLHAKVEEFFPEWMWKICDEISGVLMIHIMRNEALADPDNQRALRRLSRKYPNCRVILAHVARSFNYRHGRRSFQSIVDLDNVYVDTSAVTEADSVRCAIEHLGPRRILFGTDYPVNLFEGRCVSLGDAFFWIHPSTAKMETALPAEKTTVIGVEALLCLREACDDSGLRKSDVQRIFYDNALDLLAPHLPAKAVAEKKSGAELWREARGKISCGTGLMSKRAEQFDLKSWPAYFSRCSGSDVWDMQGRRLVDFAGGVGAILLGYADPDVTRAVRRRLNLGTYCNLVSPDEPELADLLLGLHPWAGRVRFARGGGEAVGMAVRIARAATGKSGVAFCGYHGWQDWYLAANLGSDSALDGHLIPGLQPLGVPRELQGTAEPFRFNDLASLDQALNRLEGRLATVVMEPMRSQFPQEGFLQAVAARCRAAGAIFIVDEVSSGWRCGFPGALSRFGVDPDLVVYAKAMSNGIPFAAVVGREDVMEAANSSFISSSYWTDGIGPAAALACLTKMRDLKVQPRVWKLGETMRAGLDQLAARHPVSKLKVGGMPCASTLSFDLGAEGSAAKAVLIRKMLARGFLASSALYMMHAHTPARIRSFHSAMDESLQELDILVAEGRLQAEAGVSSATHFARLA